MNSNCTTCVNGVWCRVWGEWKCLTRKKRYPVAVENCLDHKKRPTSMDEPKCQCEDCLANAEE